MSAQMRVGQGFDVHRFGPGDQVVIGGVRIPFSQGLVAHSDGDVLAHALCDALLGAIGAGDIGRHFPDSDERYRGADSIALLGHCYGLVAGAGLALVNADTTVIAEQPRMAAYIPAMRERLAAALGVEAARVNVKATTTEGLGFTGRGEGIAAQAVVLLAPAGEQQ